MASGWVDLPRMWDGRRAIVFGMAAAAALVLAACSSGGGNKAETSGNEAVAQETGNAAAAPAQPAPPSGDKLAEAVRSGRTVQVGVFGDSFSDGIWWALDQEYHRGNQIAVHKFGRPATGFADYTRLDLLADVRGKLESQPLDIAIIAFGANDTQPLHGAEHPTPFLSDEWKRVVGGRIEAMINLFKERGIAVMWVGLPKMRSADYDERVTRLNEYYASEMRRLGVPYVETVSITSDAHGNFTPNLTGADGQSRPARNSDGIHMTMSGYEVLVRPLSERLRAAIDAARGGGAQPRG